jgi:hypothetical protein
MRFSASLEIFVGFERSNVVVKILVWVKGYGVEAVVGNALGFWVGFAGWGWGVELGVVWGDWDCVVGCGLGV